MRDVLMIVGFILGLCLIAVGAWVATPAAGLIVAGAEITSLVVAYALASDEEGSDEHH